jgi:hypothetical protein
MSFLKNAFFLSSLCFVLTGCPDEPVDPPGEDVCVAVDEVQEPQTCNSRVDGKLGGEDCKCECDVQCAAGYACQGHFCVPVACEVDDDCNDGQVCIPTTGACSEPICQTNEDCNPGQACIGGTCTVAPDPGSVAQCVISGATVSRQGQVTGLSATSFSTGGAVVSQMAYAWTITAGNTSASAADGGLVTGGEVDGVWTVQAAVLDATGNPSATVCTHDGTNFADVAAGELRVLVLDQRNGAAIGGAHVVVIVDGNPLAQDSLPSGQTLFADISGTVESVSVFYDTEAQAADYVTLVAPSSNDLAIYLFTREKGKTAGVEGSFDFSTLPDRQLKIGLAGASLAGSIADIDFMTLIGQTVQTQVNIPGLPIPEEGVPLPQGITMQFGPSAFKERFQAISFAGTRSVWGLGGSFRLGAIVELLPTIAPLIEDSSAGLPVGQLLGAIMPLFAQMQHAAKVGIKVDSVACTAGNLPNGDPVDCVEAFGGHFGDHTLSFVSGLDFKTAFAMPTLPAKGDGYLSAVLGLVGVDMPGQGMVPLGIGIGVDDLDTSDEEAGDGQVSGMNGAQDGALSVGYARSHSGLDGHGVQALFLALDFDGLLGGGLSDSALSGIVSQAEYFNQCANEASCATQATRASFLALPDAAAWNALTRSYTAPSAVDGADYYRFGLEGAGGKWTFYHVGGASFIVPPVPAGLEDRSSRATVQAFDLNGDNDLNSLMSLNAINMDAVNSVTSAFSSIDCIAGGTGCVLTDCDDQNACEEAFSCVAGACTADPE